MGRRQQAARSVRPSDQIFAHYQLAPCGGNTVAKILPSPSGVLWVASGGLLTFDPRTGASTCQQPGVDTGQPNPAASSGGPQPQLFDIYAASADQLWLASDTGLYTFDVPASRFTLHRPKPPAGGPPPPESPPSPDRQAPPEGQPSPLSGFSVHSLYPDGAGHLWVGTVVNGLLLFDLLTETFIAHYQPSPTNPDGPSGAPIDLIYQSREGCALAWYGLQRRGPPGSLAEAVHLLPPRPGQHQHLPGPADARRRSGCGGHDLAREPDRLTRFDRQQGMFKHYIPRKGPRPPGEASAVDITSIFPDNQGGIWFDGVDGIYRFDEAKETFESYRPAELEGRPFVIRAMAEDQEHNFWALTDGENVLYRFDRASKQFSTFRRDPANPTSLGPPSRER